MDIRGADGDILATDAGTMSRHNSLSRLPFPPTAGASRSFPCFLHMRPN
jgi:hypothetical protein